MAASPKYLAVLQALRDKKGSDLTREEAQMVHDHMSPEDLQVAPTGLQTIDNGLSSVANTVNKGVSSAEDNSVFGPWVKNKENLLKLAQLPGAIIGKGANYLMDVAGIPKGPQLSDALPNTAEATGLNPNARDLLPLIAMEGLGRVGGALKGYGERGTLKAFEEGKPALPPNASKDMAGDILDKNYLPHQEAASDVLTDAMLKLKDRGLGASSVAKEASDAGRSIPISPQRIRDFNSLFPEHEGGQDLMNRLEASQRGEITPDFVESKPGYTKQEKILTPSETNQVQQPQGDLFDQDYYAKPDAYSKPVPDFVAHPERGVFPPSPEIQKPIEPELAGSSTQTPANYEFKETQVPPEGDYQIHPDSLYDMFSYGNKNKHRAYTRDPITQQVVAKDPRFGQMQNGLRNDLRSDPTPLSDDQMQSVKSYDPDFAGSSVGDAVAHLNGITADSIGSQKILGKSSVQNSPLGFMQSVYSNPDRRAFAQRLGRDSGLNDILDYADKYGASKDYADALSQYSKEGVSGDSFNPDKFAKHILYGGVKPALALEAGKLVGDPSMRYGASQAVGSVLQPLAPSNVWNKISSPSDAQ